MADTDGGSTFNFWNLVNTMRFGTDVGSAGNSAFYVKSGAAGDVVFNGEVGIKQANPAYPLDVTGSVRMTGTLYNADGSEAV